MINLPNGCKCSNLSIYPKNWKSKTAKISIDWYIIYRFYDPRFQKPKQVMLKGMNQFKTLAERQEATLKVLDGELSRLLADEYNPFSETQEKSKGIEQANSETPILSALKIALDSLSVSPITKKDIKYALTQIEKAIKFLGLESSAILELSKKHIKQILETASKTPDRYNKNRSYLI